MMRTVANVAREIYTILPRSCLMSANIVHFSGSEVTVILFMLTLNKPSPLRSSPCCSIYCAPFI